MMISLTDSLRSQMLHTAAKLQARANRRILCSGSAIATTAESQSSPGQPSALLGRARLRVLSYRWHVPHQYELHKQPWDFTLLTDFGGKSSCWDLGQRPLRPNARLARMSEVIFKDFDLAILHFDENCLHPARAGGVVGPGWGACFRWLRENLSLPMVAVCHGPPPFQSGPYDPLDQRIDEDERLAIVEYLGDIPVVSNSRQAMAQWGFRRSQVIWHGFDPAEFSLSEPGLGVLSLSDDALSQLPVSRGKVLYDAVLARLNRDERPIPFTVVEPDAALRGNDYAYAKFRNYVNAVGRRAIYFNPTRRSPMPRSRGEAMMSGLVSVSANNHDVDCFIDHGYNGFFSDDPGEIADILQQLNHDSAWCRKVGLRSRETACEVFGISRYLSEWSQLVERCLHRHNDGVLRGD